MKADYKKLLIASCFTLIVFYLFVIITGRTLIMSTEYENFERFCDWVDSNLVFKYVIMFITYYFNWVFAFYTIHKCKLFGYKPIRFTLFIFAFWLLKLLFVNYQFDNCIDFIVFGGLILSHIKRWKLGLITCLYTLGVVILTSTIKGVFVIGLNPMELSTLEGLVFMLDNILMSIILYLYIMNRERSIVNEKT
ncbi:MAG: hypothetical protein R3Y05_01380 [bacterium]